MMFQQKRSSYSPDREHKGNWTHWEKKKQNSTIIFFKKGQKVSIEKKIILSPPYNPLLNAADLMISPQQKIPQKPA